MGAMQKTVTETWRKQVLEEHRQLNAATAELREFLGRERPPLGEKGAHTWASEVSRRVVDLHAMLVRHFRYEEEGGMVEDLIASHPRAKRQAEELVDDHRKMLAECRAVMTAVLAYSEGDTSADQALRRRMTALLDRLHEHERTENDLILELELHDLGQGD